MTICGKETEVYSRIVGYYRPVSRWNIGKQEEYKDRVPFKESKTLKYGDKNEKTNNKRNSKLPDRERKLERSKETKKDTKL